MRTLPARALRWPAPPARKGPVVALLAPRYPAPSETFVYRDVRSLRHAGLEVVVAALRPAHEAVDDPDGPVAPAEFVAYGGRTFAAAAAEVFARPWRSLRTLALAVADALSPGEPAAWAVRAKLPLQAFFALGLARRLRERRVERVHAHFAHAPATLGMYAAAQLGVPFSFTGHANDLFRRRALLARKLERAAFVACISAWHRELYASLAPASPRHRPIVRCGVDLRSWVPAPAAARDGALRALFVGRLVEKKGLDVLLRALAQPETAGIRLRVLGDGPLRGPWEALARGLGVEVEWLGARGNAEVRRELRSADLLVLPCRTDAQGDRDGIPVALMEAMASGVPVVAGDLPAIRELVEDGVSGRLAPGGDVEALARTLAGLAGDPELRARLARGGRARVEAEFSLEANGARLAQALREAAAP